MENKKIAFCYHSSNYGGVEKHILDLTKGLSNEFEIFVLCPTGDLSSDYLKAGALVKNLYPRNEFDVIYIYKLVKFLKDEKIDIIHGHELKSGFLSMIAGFIAKTPKRIYHVHTPFIFWRHKNNFKKYVSKVVNFVANFIAGNYLATDVIALTPYIKSVRVGNEKINSKKIITIPNGVPVLDFKDINLEIANKFDKSLFYFGYIARFTVEKNHENLIKAFALVSAVLPDVRLILVGGGELLEKMQSLVAEKEISNKVIFTNHVSDIEKVTYMTLFDVLAFPSHAEGFGIALVEGMQLGIPIICSDIPVLHDIGQDAVLYFNKDDIFDIASKMEITYADYDNLKSKNSKTEQKIASDFSMERFVENYKKLYLK